VGLVRVEFTVAGRRVVVTDDMPFKEFGGLWMGLRDELGEGVGEMVDRVFVWAAMLVVAVHELNEALRGGENRGRGDDSG